MEAWPQVIFDRLIIEETSRNRPQALSIDHFDNLLKKQWLEYDSPEYNRGTRSPRWYLRVRLKELCKGGIIATPRKEHYSYPKDDDPSTKIDWEQTWYHVKKNAKEAIKIGKIFRGSNSKWGEVVITGFEIKNKKETINFSYIERNGKIIEDLLDEEHFEEAIVKLNTAAGRCQIPRKRIRRNIALVGLVDRLEFDEENFVIVKSLETSVDNEDIITDEGIEFEYDDEDANRGAKKRAKTPGVQRIGAHQFRKNILQNYNHKCAISGTSITDAIQAAHIIPYNGPSTNRLSNGLALRSDIHRLFDLGKIRIYPSDLRIHLHPEIESEYGPICFDALVIPSGSILPNMKALEFMWNFEKNRWF